MLAVFIERHRVCRTGIDAGTAALDLRVPHLRRTRFRIAVEATQER